MKSTQGFFDCIRARLSVLGALLIVFRALLIVRTDFLSVYRALLIRAPLFEEQFGEKIDQFRQGMGWRWLVGSIKL